MLKLTGLFGYENRLLSEEDFEDDTEDAGEIGANQNITAIYEIIPIENINYRDVPTFQVDFRYKQPDSETSIPINLDIYDQGNDFSSSTDYMKFCSSVAAFSMLLTDSEYKGTSNYDEVLNWLDQVNLNDQHQFKSEFRELVVKAKDL